MSTALDAAKGFRAAKGLDAARGLGALVIPFPAARTGAAPAGTERAGTERDARASTVVNAHLRITRRGRVVATTLMAIPLVIAAVVFAINGGGALASNEHGHAASFSHVTVSSGQSLWQIAERIAPAADPRDVVSSIVDLNQLQSAMVMPGQRLAIPTEYSR